MQVTLKEKPEFLLCKDNVKSGIIEFQNGVYVFRSGTFKQILKKTEYEALTGKVSKEAPTVTEDDDAGGDGGKKALEDMSKAELLAICEETLEEGSFKSNMNKAELIELIKAATD